MDDARELMLRMYDAFNRRDVDAMLDCLDPDVEARPLIGSVERRVLRGHAEVRRWLTEFVPEAWAELEAHAEGFVEGDDGTLVVLVRNAGRGAASGAPAEQHVAHLVRVRDGRIAVLTSYPDRAEALTAAGIER